MVGCRHPYVALTMLIAALNYSRITSIDFLWIVGADKLGVRSFCLTTAAQLHVHTCYTRLACLLVPACLRADGLPLAEPARKRAGGLLSFSTSHDQRAPTCFFSSLFFNQLRLLDTHAFPFAGL